MWWWLIINSSGSLKGSGDKQVLTWLKVTLEMVANILVLKYLNSMTHQTLLEGLGATVF